MIMSVLPPGPQEVDGDLLDYGALLFDLSLHSSLMIVLCLLKFTKIEVVNPDALIGCYFHAFIPFIPSELKHLLELLESLLVIRELSTYITDLLIHKQLFLVLLKCFA